jgi:hypothetical protein
MRRRDFMSLGCVGLFGLVVSRWAEGQPRLFRPPLAALAQRNELRCFNRVATHFVDGTREGVRLNEASAMGAAFVPGIEFATGTLEIDIRGKDVQQRSFVGIAFHGTDLICDAVYFRPFNFRASDPLARSHAVQYQSAPAYSWQRLRSEQPGKFENAVSPVPDPNDWFHARIVVTDSRVSVFVAGAGEPCFEVGPLNARKQGSVGLWAGNNSGGNFANLVISPT